MVQRLFCVVREALQDESLPLLCPGSPLLQNSLFQPCLNHPQLFRVFSLDGWTSSVGSCKNSQEEVMTEGDQAVVPMNVEPLSNRDPRVAHSSTGVFHGHPTPNLVPQFAPSEGLKLVNQVVFEDPTILHPTTDLSNHSQSNNRESGCEEKLVEVLRVRRWLAASACTSVIESFEMLRVPAGLIQPQKVVTDRYRVIACGAVIRAVVTSAKLSSIDFSVYRDKTPLDIMRLLFYEVPQPILQRQNPSNTTITEKVAVNEAFTSITSSIASSLTASTLSSQGSTSVGSNSFGGDAVNHFWPSLFSHPQPCERIHGEQRCSSVSRNSLGTYFSAHSQGETLTSVSVASVVASTSASTVKSDSPKRVKPGLEEKRGTQVDVVQHSLSLDLFTEEAAKGREISAKRGETLLLWRKCVTDMIHRTYNIGTNRDVASGWQRWCSFCSGVASRALIVDSIRALVMRVGGSRRSFYAAVQYLDCLVGSTPNPIKVCQELYRRLEACSSTSSEEDTSEHRNGSDSVSGERQNDDKKTSGNRSPCAGRHRRTVQHRSHGKKMKDRACRREGPFFPVNEEHPVLNTYLLSLIGGCSVLGCKMADQISVPVERLVNFLNFDYTSEEFLQVEVMILETLKHSLVPNTMESIVEFLLYVFSGDDESLYCSSHKESQEQSPSRGQWPGFLEFCRRLSDITLRGLSPAETEEFDAKYHILPLDINPLFLGIAIVAYAARMHQIFLPEPFLALFCEEFGDSIKKKGRREFPLLPQDRCFALLEEFSRSTAKMLEVWKLNESNFNSILIELHSSNDKPNAVKWNGESSTNSPFFTSSFPSICCTTDGMSSSMGKGSFSVTDTVKKTSLWDGRDPEGVYIKNKSNTHIMDIAIQYVHESWKSYKKRYSVDGRVA